MNILFVFPLPFIPSRGGVEKVTDILAKEFIKQGHNLFYLHLPRGIDDYVDYEPPAKVLRLSGDKKTPKHILIKDYQKLLSKHNIDIVINQAGALGGRKLFLTKKLDSKSPKIISVIHCDPMVLYNHLQDIKVKVGWNKHILRDALRYIKSLPLLGKIQKNLYLKKLKDHYQYLSTHSDEICCLSKLHIPSLKDLIGDKDKHSTSNISAIPNPSPYVPSLTLPKKEKIILYVGRFDKAQKRPDRLLDAWRLIADKNPDWHLVFIGQGGFMEKVMQMAAQVPRVHFEGTKDSFPYYKKASILGMTSNYEGLPMVLIEAMSQGTVPIVYNSFPNASEIITHRQDGILVPAFSTEEYANMLQELIQNDDLLNYMARNAIESSHAYKPSIISNQWESLFQKLVN